MDFNKNFTDLSIFFEDEGFSNKIENIVLEISKYDVYDVIARISGLNLLPQNQNKSILLDRLIASVLCKHEDTYKSSYRMSDSKFKKLIQRLSNTNLARTIDPNENTFVQKIMFRENYNVFNGIDHTPAYNLQMLIDVLFYYENDFPSDFLNKVDALITFVLKVSEEIACKIDLISDDTVFDNSKVTLPSSSILNKFVSYVKLEEQLIDYVFRDYPDLTDDIIASFGTKEVGSLNNRPFYCFPFIRDSKSKNIVILNVSILPTFVFFKVLKIAEDFYIKEGVINRFNDYVWSDCKESLKVLGHIKIKEDQLNIKLENKSYYKEMIASVYNNQIMLTIFICDDAFNFSKNTLHSAYPDERHTFIIEERLKYYNKKLKKYQLLTIVYFA